MLARTIASGARVTVAAVNKGAPLEPSRAC